MSLLALHRVFIIAAILLCLAYATWEVAHSAGHSPARVLIGSGIPALLAGALAAYLRYMLRKS